MEFICLVKCASLLIELLPSRHPQFRELDGETRQKVKKDSQELLDAISAAKSELSSIYEDWRAKNPEGAELSLSSLPSSSKSTQNHASASSSDASPWAPTSAGVRPSADGLSPLNPSVSSSSRSEADSQVRGKSPTSAFSFGTASRRPSIDITSISYPTLQPKLSSRMSIHQKQQGFAPSSNATARYYQTLKANELVPPPSSSTVSASNAPSIRNDTWKGSSPRRTSRDAAQGSSLAALEECDVT
ncbi:hypothetical protein IE53DRAFT_361881 [Violaceomyces palustris]|uniref:Uncharacterized protein n=1 Tax=Violaceomyces palustris TaxID=1673888 RepID=A0ACD0NZ83_9BASI|nr:hypothetical protein IE53DRAFT_361881 [Violaceomyces palustris]